MAVRVVHVIARMNVGGPAALITELLTCLPEQSLLTGLVQEGEVDYLDLRRPGTPYVRVPGLGRSPRPRDDLRALAFLVKRLRQLRPDIVHTHTAKAGVLGRIAARVAGVPNVVHTFHGHLLQGYFGTATLRSVIVAERLLAQRTDRLVAVGTQVRDDLLRAGIGRKEQYAVIPPGVSVARAPSRDDARRLLGIPDAGVVAACVGRLTSVKRPDRLLAVAALLPEITVLVAGGGPLLAQTQQSAPDNVRFLGWRSDVEVVYAAADVALLTSDNEGMPLSLIEAALCGVPAVSTDVGSAREVVTGEVTTSDPEAIAAAVRRVAYAGLGETARARAEHLFSREAMVAAHAELYTSLAASKTKRS